MATNEDLMTAINEIKADFRAHVAEEKPILDSARLLLSTHGTEEMVRARINFVHSWMERERDRSDLRKALIKHGFLLAMTAIVIFILRAVWVDVVELIRAGTSVK